MSSDLTSCRQHMIPPTEDSVMGFRSPCYTGSLMARLTRNTSVKLGFTSRGPSRDAKDLQDPVLPLRYGFSSPHCVTKLSHPWPQMASLTFILSYLPLWVTHIFSVLPAVPPSLTCSPISLEPLLPLALRSFPSLPQICQSSPSCCCCPAHREGPAPHSPSLHGVHKAPTNHRVGKICGVS